MLYEYVCSVVPSFRLASFFLFLGRTLKKTLARGIVHSDEKVFF